jgi:hypothetical protein
VAIKEKTFTVLSDDSDDEKAVTRETPPTAAGGRPTPAQLAAAAVRPLNSIELKRLRELTARDLAVKDFQAKVAAKKAKKNNNDEAGPSRA